MARLSTSKQGIGAAEALRRIQQLEENADLEITQLVGRGFEEIITSLIPQISLDAALQLDQYLRRMQSEWSDVRKGLVADARTLGQLVQEEALQIIQTDRVRQNVDPRVRNRLHGALERAVDQMVEPTQDGVVIRTDILDREARHWRRINYGVGQQAEQGAQALIRNLAQAGPSERPMMLPQGLWFAGSKAVPFRANAREDFFIPFRRRGQTGDRQWFPTRGIAGKHFLERAFQIAEEDFPALVDDRVRQWARTAGRGAGGRGRVVLGRIG